MSTDFITLKKFRTSDLFDGRLEKFGVREHINDETAEHNRCLTDGRNYVWVSITEDGLVSGFIPWVECPRNNF